MKVRFLAAVVAGLLAAGAQAEIPTYNSIQLQARTNLLVNDAGYNLPPGSSFNSISADIDAQGRVAFPVQVVPNGASSNPGVWFGGNGAGGIVYNGPVDSLISSSVSMNDDGKIVFTLIETLGADGIYRYDDATHSGARVSTSPVFPNSYSSVSINRSGVIGFQANFSGGRMYASVPPTGPARIHLVDKGLDPASPYTYLYTPAIDELGYMTGKVATSADFTSSTEIRGFAADGTTTLAYAQNVGAWPGSPYTQFDNSIGLAPYLQVAWIATRVSDGRRALYRPAGPWLLAEESPTGLVRNISFFPAAINTYGLTVFRGKDANGEALFLATNTDQVVRLIGKGDRVQTDLGLAQIGQHNSTDSVFSGAPSINENGDIVFIAALHPDGQDQVEWGTGVFVARASRDAIFGDGFESPPGTAP